MKLYELAFGCWIYNVISGNDSRVTELRLKTSGQVDPYNSGHQKVLFTWLNRWGCRQFDKANHMVAARSLESWADTWLSRIPSNAERLETIDETQIDALRAAYDDLHVRLAGKRTLRKDGSTSYVTYGPVGAAKTLFALRPNICPPWDTSTLRKFVSDDSGASYCEYLRMVLSNLTNVSIQADVRIAELPTLLSRANSTPPKLIDEYYWVTVTKGFTAPSPDALKRWIRWAELG
jgi:hypothetical protein